MSNDIIDRVHDLAIDESQPESVDGTVMFEWGTLGEPTESSVDDADDEHVFDENFPPQALITTNPENKQRTDQQMPSMEKSEYFKMTRNSILLILKMLKNN